MTLRFCLHFVAVAWVSAVPAGSQAQSSPLVWSGSFGGGGFEELRALAVGPDGGIWAAGSSDAPWDLPRADVELELGDDRAGFDVVVVKISPDGQVLLWKAVLGGPGRDVALGIDIAADGIVTVSGMASAGFPVSGDAYQPENGGGLDVFVARLDPSFDDPEAALLYSTFLGGAGEDMAVGVHSGADGILRVAGHTASRDFPVVPGSFSTSYGGGAFDLFVSCLDLKAPEPGVQLVYSSFVGGSGDDACVCDQPPGPGPYARHQNTHMTVAPDGAVLMAGHTLSGNFPTTPGAFQRALGGDFDFYVFRMVCDTRLSLTEQYPWGTLIGGESFDGAQSVRVDAGGHVWVLGYTWSSSFPTTPDAHQRNPLGESDGFLARLDPLGVDESQLVYSTRLGGSRFDLPGDFLLLLDDRVLCVGRTGSTNFPVTCGAVDTELAGDSDAFALILDLSPGLSSPDRLVYGTTWGGSGNELFRRVRPLAEPGLVAVAGWSTSFDTPIHGEPFQGAFGGSQDSPLAVFDLRVPRAVLDVDPRDGAAPLRVAAGAGGSSTPAGTDLLDVSWRIDGSAASTGPSHTFDLEDPGRHLVEVTVTNSSGHCDTQAAVVTVRAPASDVSPWTLSDVGDPAFPGGARRDGEALVLIAGGDRLSGSDDAHAFLWQSFACDGRVTARLDAVESLSINGQVGLQLREGLGAGTRHVSFVLEGLSLGRTRLRLAARKEPDGTTTYEPGQPAAVAPLWLRLERAGDEVRAELAGGAEEPLEGGWTLLGTLTIPDFGSELELLAGLAGMANEPAAKDTTFRPLTATFREVSLECEAAARFRRGDCNDDGAVDISDGVCILTWLFLGGATPGCVAVTNTNGDEHADISDATYVLNHLFLGGPAPVAPYLACGPGALPMDEETCETPPSRCQE